MIFIGFDRDGTIIRDENYYIGSQHDWKEKIEILPGVIEGIKLLRKIPHSCIGMISNQSGIALQGERFDTLTEERVREVNDYVIALLNLNGVKIDFSTYCPFITPEYASKMEKRSILVNPKYVHNNHPDMKPNIGMLKQFADSQGLKLEQCHLHFIGDRFTDVQTALNVPESSGFYRCEHLIESSKTKELDDIDKTKKHKQEHPEKLIFVHKNVLDAAKMIYEFHN